MRRKIYYLLAVAGLFFSVQVIAQMPTLKTSVDKQHILIGEHITYTVQAKFPENYKATWLSLPDSINHFELVKNKKIDTIFENGMYTCTQQIILTSFDSGKNTIPSFAINFNGSINLLTDSIPIDVAYSPLDSVKTFHDIKSVIEVDDSWPLWMWISAILAFLLLVVISIFTIRYFIKNKSEKKIFHSKLSPFDEAMQSLNALQKKELLQNGHAKIFHTKLSDIFKRFISRKMHVNMLNLTSSDILLKLNETLLSKEDTSALANSLRMGDAVKFAKYIPPETESDYAFMKMKNVIEQINKLQQTNTTTA